MYNTHKIVKTMGKKHLVYPKDIIFSVFKKAVFEGTLAECQAYMNRKVS